MPDIQDNLVVASFLKELMEIQRRYANELKNVRTNRQAEVKDLLDKFSATEDVNVD